jgi:uncharacterized metal-binding protein YceD (DUF177 family)
MNREESTGGAPERASRFSYHGDEPTEGGVHSVGDAAGRKARTGGATGAGGPRGNSEGGRPGVPGPEERLLDITELVHNVGMRYRHHFELEPYVEGDLDVAEPAVGDITLTNTGAALLVRGSAKASLRLDCVRCLASTVQPVEADLEEEFPLVSESTAFRQDEVKVVDDSGGAAVVEGNVFNLGELLRQNLLLAAPTAPLCSEECGGIDLAGREGASYLPPSDDEDPNEVTPEPEDDAPAEETTRPFADLGALLEAKRRSAEQNGR